MAALLRAYRHAYSGLPREVWLLSITIFINRCGTMVLPFLTLYLRTEQGYSATEAGRMLAVYGLGAIAGAQLGGRLTQRCGGVNVAFVGLALSAPGFLALPHCDRPWHLAAALLYLSVVFEMMRPAIATATTEFAPPERHAQAFALNRLATNLGMSVGPVVGGLLATIDYQLLFTVNAVFVGLSAAMIGWSFGLHPQARTQITPASAPARSPWSDRRYLAFLALQLVAGSIFMQLIGVLPLFLAEQWNFSEAHIGLLFVVNTLLIVVFEMVLTARLAKADPLRMTALGTGLICMGLGGAAFGSGFAYAVCLTLVWTLGEMLSAPFTLAYVARRSQAGQRGAYMGLFSTTMAASFVLSPMVGTWLYAIDPYLPWWSCLAMAALLPAGFLSLAQGEGTSPETLAPLDEALPLQLTTACE